MVLPVTPKVGLGNNFPKLNVCDVVPRIRRINRTNYVILLKSVMTSTLNNAPAIYDSLIFLTEIYNSNDTALTFCLQFRLVFTTLFTSKLYLLANHSKTLKTKQFFTKLLDFVVLFFNQKIAVYS